MKRLILAAAVAALLVTTPALALAGDHGSSRGAHDKPKCSSDSAHDEKHDRDGRHNGWGHCKPDKPKPTVTKHPKPTPSVTKTPRPRHTHTPRPHHTPSVTPTTGGPGPVPTVTATATVRPVSSIGTPHTETHGSILPVTGGPALPLVALAALLALLGGTGLVLRRQGAHR
jgi:hypothetical protein